MAETAVRAQPETTGRVQDACPARAPQRSMSRALLQPSVHDFNGNIINKAIDEDQVVWQMGKNQFKYTPPLTEFAYPVPPSFRRGGAFSTVHLESSRLPFVSNGFKTNRISAWAEEVHRRHVARTARVRARLSPKPRGSSDRVIPTSSGISGIYESEFSFSLSLPENGERDLEDVRLTSFSRTSSRNDVMTSRSRPATTGRYFDSSNGLRNIRSSPAVFRSRPNTASPCSGPGLKVKKMTLHQKELII